MWKKGLTLFLLLFLYLSLLKVFADTIPEMIITGEDVSADFTIMNRLPEFAVAGVTLFAILYTMRLPCSLYRHLRTLCYEWKRKD